STGPSTSQFNSRHRPNIHSKSFVPSFIATYSASVVLWALISCFRDAYETTLPSSIVT
ncbi:hypothetical protein PHYSODRAFT_411168, partial [Phytophthora sojae]